MRIKNLKDYLPGWPFCHPALWAGSSVKTVSKILLMLIIIVGFDSCSSNKRQQEGEGSALPIEQKTAEAAKDAGAGGANTSPVPLDRSRVIGEDAITVRQLASIGSQFTYEASTKSVYNLDVSAEAPLGSSTEVVENSPDCQGSPKAAASHAGVSVCVSSTKVSWTPAGDQDFVVKVKESVSVWVISKPQFLTSYVGSRDAAEKFSGNQVQNNGDTLVLLGQKQSGKVAAAPAAVVVASGGAPAAPTADSSGRPAPPSTPDARVQAAVPNFQPQLPGNTNFRDWTTGSGGGAPEQLLANSVGFYLSDYSLITVMGTDPASLKNRAVYYVESTATDPMSLFNGLGAITNGQSFTIGSSAACSQLSAAVFGIKLYNLLLEVPVQGHCTDSKGVITIAFPKLVVTEAASGRKSDGPTGAVFTHDAPASDTGNINIAGWEKFSNHKSQPKYEQIDTSVGLLIAPALQSMESGKKVYAAHFFVGLDKHNPGAGKDMKNTAWRLVSNIDLGVFTFKNAQGQSVAPAFHTLSIRPYLAHLEMKRVDASGSDYIWRAGDGGAKAGTIAIPQILVAGSSLKPETRVNTIKPDGGVGGINNACGFDVMFSPLGESGFEVALAALLGMTRSSVPYKEKFYLETIFDLLEVHYSVNNSTSCIPENEVVLTTVGSTPGVVSSVREFDAVSGPKLNFDVELKKK